MVQAIASEEKKKAGGDNPPAFFAQASTNTATRFQASAR
jgi:hypothetical protein